MKQPHGTQLAQLNVATALDDLDSPRLAGFVGALDRINSLVEQSPGFVWRLQDESGSAVDVQASDDPRFIVNLSVWETPADLDANGPGERAFGWESLPSTQLWKSQRCA